MPIDGEMIDFLQYNIKVDVKNIIQYSILNVEVLLQSECYEH